MYDISNQLDLFSTASEQVPVYEWVKFISKDDDINPDLYTYIDNLFSQKMLILDLETYGKELPDNVNKNSVNIKDYALSSIYGDIRLFQIGNMIDNEVLIIDFYTRWDKPSQKYLNFIEYLKNKTLEFAKNKGNFIGHNIAFDLEFLRVKWDVKMWKAWDTMILSQLLYAGILSYKHNLKDCCERELEVSVDKTEQSSDFSLELRNSQINYAAMDIIYTKNLFIKLIKDIKKEGLQKVAELEAEYTPALVEKNYWGMPVDLVELDRQINWFDEQLKVIEREFEKLYPGQNIRSSLQVSEIVNDLTSDKKKTNRGSNKSVDLAESDRQIDWFDEQLKAIETEFEKLYPNQSTRLKSKKSSSKSDLALLHDKRVVQLVLDYRTLQIYFNYCKQVKQEIIWVGGVPRVSGRFRQLTNKGQGRTCSGNKKAPIKCQGVNLQNPPSGKSLNKRLKKLGCPRVRDIFKVPSGFKMIDIDLPAAHLAIATYMSGETAIEDCAREKIDLHAITMHSVFSAVDKYAQYRHLDIKQITTINKNESHELFQTFNNIRSTCKGVVYGGLNNQSAPTLQNTIKITQNDEVSLDICEAMVEAFPSIFPKIAELRDLLWKKANSKKIEIDGNWYGLFQDDYGTYNTPGYRRKIYSLCKTSPDGKRVYVPKGDIANCWLATESSSVKLGITKIYQEGVFNDKFNIRLSSICHDEVILYCPENEALEAALLTRDSMRQGLEYFTGNGKIPYPDMMKDPECLITDGWEH